MPLTSPSTGAHAIHEPYPGLRPFLDHEYALLRGRDEPIRQVLERLERTSFVAIIGGSGSGKSSLIRAGVVPRLRARALDKAGDYWIPVVFTPGTAPGGASARSLFTDKAETPVTRLAWKFAQVLRAAELSPAPADAPSDDAEAHAPALPLADEIAAFLRQGAGFNRLTDAYHHLLPRRRPKTDKARFLFVIDQFEELFHPSNRDSVDARTIVEAVVDHFQKPNERTFVVMTMRSEHLADCAGYLHLPDAINRSFYLVRRHNSHELRQVITEPAEVYRQERSGAGEVQPTPVDFAPAVVARLLSDANQIEDDADHLPLLQHLLARLWSAALHREHLPPQDAAPRQITMADLEAAVSAGTGSVDATHAPNWLASEAGRKLNTLRASLENWAEHLYMARDEAQRALLDQLLRRLAFRDPSNGMHFQQRVDVDDPRLFADVAQPRELLWSLLVPGFVDEVNYLFWDDENPEHVTLKVSHEAFIRGWPRFRNLVDKEAERFDEFLATMRRCVLWQAQGQDAKVLLESSELERIAGAGLDTVICDDAQLQEWLAAVRLYRRNDRLLAASPHVQAFVAASHVQQAAHKEAEKARLALEQEFRDAFRAEQERTRIAEAQQKADAEVYRAQQLQFEAEQAKMREEAARGRAETERALEATARAEAEAARVQEQQARTRADAARLKEVSRRQRAVITAAVSGLILGAAFFAFWFRVLRPVAETLGSFATAQAEAAKRVQSDGSPMHGAKSDELTILREAAGDVSKARQQMQAWWWPSPKDFDAQFQLVESASTEFRLNEELRRLLATAPWRPGQAAKPAGTPLPSPVLAGQTCKASVSGALDKPATFNLPGTFVRVGGAAHGLFVPATTPQDESERNAGALVVYNARFAGDACDIGTQVIAFPRSLRPALLFESSGAVVGAVDRARAEKALTLYDIEWSWDMQSNAMAAQFMRRRQITSDEAQPVYDLVGNDWSSDVHGLPTWRLPGGVEVDVKGTRWTLLSGNAQGLPKSTLLKDWADLQPESAGAGLCAYQATVLQKQFTSRYDPSFRFSAKALRYAPQGICVVVQAVDRRAAGAEAPVLPTVDVTAALYYDSALRAAYGQVGNDKPAFPPVAAASTRFVAHAPGVDWTWRWGTSGDYAGWLAADPTVGADRVPQLGKGQQVLAMPLDMQALVRQADEALKANPTIKR